MFDKPLIGINTDVGWPHRDHGADSADPLSLWLDDIERAGGIPIIVRPSAEATDLNQILDRLDGFVLSGRGDALIPRPASPPEAPWQPPELLLVHLIAERRMPFLGIGLGLQLLNQARGGTVFRLEQDETLLAAHSARA